MPSTGARHGGGARGDDRRVGQRDVERPSTPPRPRHDDRDEHSEDDHDPQEPAHHRANLDVDASLRVRSQFDVVAPDLRPPPHVGEHPHRRSPSLLRLRARRFLRFPTQTPKGSVDASRTREPRKMPFEKYRPFLPLELPDRTWPDKTHRQGAAVVLGRPARRQPGAHRPDGPRAQAADVRDPRRDGLQGDRGRLPVGVAARLRLRPVS